MSQSNKDNHDLEIVNLEKIVKEYAASFVDKEKQKVTDMENPIINWDHMLVNHSEATYVQSTDFPEPTANVLFTANFANDTPEPQTYALRTERRTKSTCNVAFKRAYTRGANLQVKLTPPSSIIGATVGFKGEIHKERGLAESTEQEIAWSVDNQIKVPSGYQTTAKLIIKEAHYSGDFTIKCTFEGDIAVTYEHKDTRKHIETVDGPVKLLFDQKQGFTKDNQGRPVFLVKGTCQCKYGVEQNVSLKESKIPQPEKENKCVQAVDPQVPDSQSID